jgi:hypothetical protein
VTTCKRLLLILALAATVNTPAFAVNQGYESATLLNAIEAQDQQVFWQFTLQVRDLVLVADYRPIVPWNFTLLQEFIIHGHVKMRFAGRQVYLVRPNGKELKLQVRLRMLQDGEPPMLSKTAYDNSYEAMRQQYRMDAQGTLVRRSNPDAPQPQPQ